MSQNAETPLGLTGAFPEDSAAGGKSAATVPQGDPPRVAGRLHTYRSRARHWYRQVRVEQCPRCSHPHLHRAPLPLVPSILRTAPCGAVYVVQLAVEAVTP